MLTQAKLPANLIEPYEWVEAGGEIGTLRAMSESEAEAYATDAAANAEKHDTDVDRDDLMSLWTWLQAHHEAR